MSSSENDRPVVKVKFLDHWDSSFSLPQYETLLAAGADVRACLENKADLKIGANERILVPTGLSFEIPAGFEIQVRPRSGLSLKTNLLVVNSPGTVDADYRGEIKIILGNFGKNEEVIEHGQRIAQLVLAPIVQAKFEIVESLTDTDRGEKGFGSTGVN